MRTDTPSQLILASLTSKPTLDTDYHPRNIPASSLTDGLSAYCKTRIFREKLASIDMGARLRRTREGQD